MHFHMIKEITRNLYIITLPMPFRLKHVHVYALLHQGKVALFDTGLDTPETFSVLETALKRIDRSIRDIDRIFISHRHGDHCGMAGRIKAESGAEILMSDTDYEFIAMSNREALMIQAMRDFYLRHGLGEEALAILAAIMKSFRKMTGSFALDRALKHGQTHAIGDWTLEVLSAPGHSTGHSCFLFREQGLLIAGDHILPDITPNLSPDLFEPSFHPLSRFVESLTEMQDLPVRLVCPAHGQPFTHFRERIEEIKEHHRERKGLTLASVRGSLKTACQVSIDLFGPELPEFDQFLAINETYVHLLELVHEGLVREETRDGKSYYAMIG
jgi:glyoxylase-like metal-dependent hydrolase (beta-lactamase superfamily II)